MCEGGDFFPSIFFPPSSLRKSIPIRLQWCFSVGAGENEALSRYIGKEWFWGFSRSPGWSEDVNWPSPRSEPSMTTAARGSWWPRRLYLHVVSTSAAAAWLGRTGQCTDANHPRVPSHWVSHLTRAHLMPRRRVRERQPWGWICVGTGSVCSKNQGGWEVCTLPPRWIAAPWAVRVAGETWRWADASFLDRRDLFSALRGQWREAIWRWQRNCAGEGARMRVILRRVAVERLCYPWWWIICRHQYLYVVSTDGCRSVTNQPRGGVLRRKKRGLEVGGWRLESLMDGEEGGFPAWMWMWMWRVCFTTTKGFK